MTSERLMLSATEFVGGPAILNLAAPVADAAEPLPALKPSFTPMGETSYADTIPADPSTTATLTIGGSVDGLLDTVGDRDWYQVTLVAGQRYTFEIRPTGAGDITDSYIRVYGANGSLIGQNDDSGGSLYSRISFTPTVSGTFYVSVGAYNDAQAGNYRVTAATAPPLPVFTNDQIATFLADGFWGGVERHFNVAPGGTITYNVNALTAPGQFLAREAFALWSDATGIAFTEIAGTAQITLDDNQSGAFANSVRSGNIIQSSTVNVSTAWLTSYGTSLNSYSFQTYIHEIGHAIGLGHAGDYNGSADYGIDNGYENDSWATTVMSYFSQSEATYFSSRGFTYQFVVTPIVADILATTSLYGTPSTTRTGNTVYGFNNTSGRAVYDAAQFPAVSYTVIDHGGTDTLDYSGFTQNQRIDLNAEAFSNVGGRVGNVTIARGSVIENAVGGSGNDTIIGNDAINFIDLGRGGDDIVSGGGGGDAFYFGAAFTAADSVDGGSGSDQIGLQGNYTLTLGAGSITGVEFIVLLPGDDNRFNGATGTNLSYAITTVDANIAAGQLLTFQANTLRAGETFTLNGAAETNGRFLTFAGLGTENLTGGQGDDGFYFGTGRFSATDRIDGQGGNDQFGLQGDFSGANAVVLGATQLIDIEGIVVLGASDTRFGGGSIVQNFNYTITTADGNVAAGRQMLIQANSLGAGEVFIFDGSAETDGSFRLFGGFGADSVRGGALADELWGNPGADRIEGGGGADVLRGGVGNDSFVYRFLGDSTASARDRILDFATGDLIDFSLLDANSVAGGRQDFVLIDSGQSFTAAGQLRITQTGTQALVEGDGNGDGIADFAIDVTVTDGHALGLADFAGVRTTPQAEELVVDKGDADRARWDDGHFLALDHAQLPTTDLLI